MLITLHSNGYEVAVNTMGAELKSFKDPSGKEYVWNSDPAFWMRNNHERAGLSSRKAWLL